MCDLVCLSISVLALVISVRDLFSQFVMFKLLQYMNMSIILCCTSYLCLKPGSSVLSTTACAVVGVRLTVNGSEVELEWKEDVIQFQSLLYHELLSIVLIYYSDCYFKQQINFSCLKTPRIVLASHGII